MKDEGKTKKQLIKELADARERLSALEEVACDRVAEESALIEEKYRLVAQYSADLIYVLNIEDETFKYVSPSVEKILGYTPEAMLSLKPEQLLTPQSYTRQFEAMQEELLKGATSTGTMQLEAIHKDGHIFPVEIHAGFIFDESGKPVEILGVARDITERKLAEDELKKSEEKYRRIVENLNEVIYATDCQAKVTYISPNVERVAGYLPADIIGRSFIEFVHPEDLDGRIENFQRILAGEDLITEYRYLTKDGGVKWVRSNARPVFEDGHVVGLQGVLIDITERKQMQEQVAHYSAELEQRLQELQIAYEKLKEVDKMKDGFLSTVSHELRTPLTSIKSFAEILLNYEGDRTVQMEFLNIISEESDRLTRLVNDFLDLSKIESGRLEWYGAVVGIPEVIEKAIAASEALVKNMNLEVYVEPDLPAVWCDRDRLEQVVTNLIDNAAKFTPSGGNIKVQAGRHILESPGGFKSMVKVSVIDNGAGISPQYHEAVFEKFTQLGDTLTSKPRGSGLGLSICREIVERYKGKIWVESEPGKGSAFSFTLPAAQGI